MTNTVPDHPLNRVLGCLLAGAVGDALGAPVEFMHRAAILRQFGPGGIRDYAMAYGRLGAITDDTQMTLFTAEGCLRTADQADDPIQAMRMAYQRWLLTQEMRGDTLPDQSGWLIQQKALFSRRAPGNTCLSALRHAGGEINHSKGCGGIMRVAPCGIVHAGAPEKAFQLGLAAARLTHGHPTGYLAAAVFAALIAALIAGTPLSDAIATARSLLVQSPEHRETLAALDDAVQRAASHEAPATAIPALGEGWIAEEALAIAVYCALQAPTLEEGIVTAVNITGDSDSTGAITGNLLGALHGAPAIPARWLEPLELRDVIETMAADLALRLHVPAATMTPEQRQRYPLD